MGGGKITKCNQIEKNEPFCVKSLGTHYKNTYFVKENNTIHQNFNLIKHFLFGVNTYMHQY